MNGYEFGSQFGSTVLAFSSGSFAVSYGNAFTSTYTPAVSIFDANCTPLSTPLGTYTFPFSGPSLSVQMVGQPEIAENSDGSILFRWAFDDGFFEGGDLVAATVSSTDGSVLNAGNIIANTGSLSGNALAVGLDGKQFTFSVYNPSQGLDPNVRASDGSFISIYCVDNAFDNFTDVDIVTMSDGGFLLAAVELGSPITNSIMLQYREASGLAVGSGQDMFVIDPIGLSDRDTSIELAALPNGGFALAYIADFEDGPGVALRVIADPETKPDGSGLIRVDSNILAEESSVAIEALPNGWVVLSWTEASASGITNIMARVFDEAGTPVPDVMLVSSGVTNAGESSIDIMINGQIVASWTDELSDGQGDSIQGAIINLIDEIRGDEGVNTISGSALNDDIWGGDTVTYETATSGALLLSLAGRWDRGAIRRRHPLERRARNWVELR